MKHYRFSRVILIWQIKLYSYVHLSHARATDTAVTLLAHCELTSWLR